MLKIYRLLLCFTFQKEDYNTFNYDDVYVADVSESSAYDKALAFGKSLLKNISNIRLQTVYDGEFLPESRKAFSIVNYDELNDEDKIRFPNLKKEKRNKIVESESRCLIFNGEEN